MIRTILITIIALTISWYPSIINVLKVADNPKIASTMASAEPIGKLKMKERLEQSSGQPQIVEGKNKYLYYRTWTGRRWRAELENIKISQLKGRITQVSDPDFIHVGWDTHNESHIDYLNDVGERWRAKVHSHITSTGEIKIDFEHFHQGSTSDLDNHYDNYMYISDWNGAVWKVTIPSIWPQKDDTPIYFECHRKLVNYTWSDWRPNFF